MRKSNNYTVLKLKNVANTRQGEGRSGLTAQYSFAEPYAYHAAVAGEFCLIRGKTSFTSDDYGNGGVLGFTAECLGEGGGIALPRSRRGGCPPLRLLPRLPCR